MDLAIIDTFVRTETAPKTAPRSSDDAPESFAEVLDSRMRQPEAVREKPETPESHDRLDAEPVETAPAKPSDGAVAAKPRVKPKAAHEAKDAPAAAENAPPADAEEATPSAKTPVARATPASLIAELLTAGQEAASDSKPTGLEAAAAIVTSVTPEKSAASTVLSLLIDDADPQSVEAPVATPAASTNPAGANPAAGLPATTPGMRNPDFALQLNAATPQAQAETPTATPTASTVADAPVLAAELTAAAEAIATSGIAPQADEPTPVELALELSENGEDDGLFATVTMGAPASATTTQRPVAGPLTAPGYAAQLVSQEPAGDASATPAPDLSKAIAAAAEQAPQDADAALDADQAPLAPTTSQDTVIAPSTADHSLRAAAQTEAAAQRGPRPAALPMVEQVAVRITKALADGIDRINVKLNPADLGHIDIRMEIGPDGKFNAVFAADRPQTVELLQRDARELARSLQEAGLRADAGSLSFNLRGQNQGQQNSAQLAALQDAGTGGHGGEALSEAMPLPANLYGSSNAANGRVDIRV